MTHVYYQNTESALEGLRENSKYFSSNSLCLDQNLNTEPYKETGMVLTRMWFSSLKEVMPIQVPQKNIL